jgi:ATP-binding protein involved in chromosome partitioning
MDIFGSGGGEQLAESAQVEFLGGIPMDPAVREGGDSGKPIVIENPDSAVTAALEEIAIKTALRASQLALTGRTEELSIHIE